MATVNDSKAPTQEIRMGQNIELAKPLHLQRLEASLDMGPFMKYAQELISKPLTSSDDESNDSDKNSDMLSIGDRYINGVITSKKERYEDKFYVYNFTQVGSQRRWLQEILLSDTETESDISDEDEYIREMLKEHVREQKIRSKYYRNGNNAQYGYFGSGLLSNYDMFPDHQRSIVGLKKRKKTREKKIERIKRSRKNKIKIENFDDDETGISGSGTGGGTGGLGELDWDDQHLLIKDELDDEFDSKPTSPIGGVGTSKRARKKALAAKTPEVMAARRRKVWQLMSKKELGKIQRAKANNHKEILTNCKKVAGLCMKISRQKAMQSQKNMKETVWRAKRLTREMQGYWKRYDRVERETRRRMEKEAEEQRKMDVEIIEAKRQQRKLNFLITQTELYAHFMSKKLGNGTEEEQLRILSQLDEEMNPRLAAIDNYDSELMKQIAQKNACDAFMTERARTKLFDVSVFNPLKLEQSNVEVDQPQPAIFQGSLKGYQIKGMTWLANLYDQGISGILADEMGLGKTVQSIAFLCHIAEKYGVWGPFLIISPASTLHNWQQEMQRFVPDFNVVPYWGSPNERKILRQFWEQKDLHTKDASFHVVITSYQLVVSDYKYFNRIKWQYMILDEAQAIKSSSSVRWKLLLGFNCRNRLLLSGTPIQNSMAELWALLHFIMPTLFDSHDEFNEWFSKDIESHAENKTGIDERQISRLHMILKPFMLRRIKKDVENELSDKIEIMVYCPLTTRQKLLYVALKKKIRIEDLLHYTVGGGDGHTTDKNFTSNLMNLVMQFRKVCNHPELFERRDARSPLYMKCLEYVVPRLLFFEGLLHHCIPSKQHLLYNKFNIFKSENTMRSLFPNRDRKEENYEKYIDLNLTSTFSFSRFMNLSQYEIENLSLDSGIIYYFKHINSILIEYELENLNNLWHENIKMKYLLLHPTIENKLNKNYYKFSDSYLNELLFTTTTLSEKSIYTYGNYKLMSMAETMEHRVIRSKNFYKNNTNIIKIENEDVIIKTEILDDYNECSNNGNMIFSHQTKCLGKSPNIFNTQRSSALSISPVMAKTTLSQQMLKSPTSKGGTNFETGVAKLNDNQTILPEHPYIPRPPRKFTCEPLSIPSFLYCNGSKVQCHGRKMYCDSRAAQWAAIRHEQCENPDGYKLVHDGLAKVLPKHGWSNIAIPDKQTLVSDAGKLFVLDNLLTRLKLQGHRVLIYSQMTKMIDLLEEYMWHRKHRYMRLDGSSKISARRDMVADFQNRADIFVFLLSTRAGGLGINLTAADTVIFYDSDWNPTVDQQAMDRAHRLGQTKQVTVYRLICKGTIEERILQRAREKSEIQRMVISGGNFKPDTLKPKEVVSLLLDDEEIELKYRQKTEERKSFDDFSFKPEKDKDKKRKSMMTFGKESRRPKLEANSLLDAEDLAFLESGAPLSPAHSDNSHCSNGKLNFDHQGNDDSSNEALIVDCDSPAGSNTPVPFYDGLKPRRRHHPRGTKRGRPRGSRRGGGSGSLGRSDILHTTGDSAQTPQSLSPTSSTVATTSSTPPSSSNLLNNAVTAELVASSLQSSSSLSSIKRGPGRPRLKPTGPVNKGFRGAPRPRKPIGPLVVPLGQSPAQTPTVRSPAMSPAPSPAPEKGLGFYQQMDEDI